MAEQEEQQEHSIKADLSNLSQHWASCPGSLMAQLKGKKLMVVPSTTDGFRAVVSALQSLDGEDGVSFQTFTLQEYHCV